MHIAIYILLAAAVIIFLLTVGAPRRALRPTYGKEEDPPAGMKQADAWYIESRPAIGTKPISCSFVEFDERGDYLDFHQHRHAYMKIKNLAHNGERLLVLIYVHGWKNNAQSGDVVKFNSFLEQVASSQFVQESGFRVHGVYLHGGAMLSHMHWIKTATLSPERKRHLASRS